MIKTILLLQLLLPGFALANQIDPFVQNGTEVSTRSPLRLSVARLDFSNGSCTATFLDPTTLLTAGHCVIGPASDAKITIRDAKNVWHHATVKALIRHPGYRMQNTSSGTMVSYDLAIVKLHKPLKVKIRPVQLHDPRSIIGVFKTVVVGFGMRGKNQQSTVLRSGVMDAEWGEVANFYGGPGLMMVPLSAPGQATCPGDSGGPVFLSDGVYLRQIGVHSLSNGCRGNRGSSSFGQIPVLTRTWIRNQMN